LDDGHGQGIFQAMANQRESELHGLLSIDRAKASLGVAEGCNRLPLDGVSLAWEEQGEGVPVVCLHGAGHGARDFKLLKEQNPADCRLLLLDWPGHGRSSPDARSFTVERCAGLLSGFLNALGLRNAVLLGSEFGAAVALDFASRHPERVRGLVLCQPAGLLDEKSPRRPSRLSAAMRLPARAMLRRPLHTVAELEQERVDSLELRHLLQRNQAALSMLALREALLSGLAQCLSPVLVVLAAKSRIYPLKHFERLLEPLVSVTPMEQPGRPKLAIFPGRHSPLWEDPARMAQALSGFAAATVPLNSHKHSWTLAAADWPARGMNQWLCTHPGCHAAEALPAEQNPNIVHGKR
jgi:pimeloyl-ACP methyl ester carboxylesterase